MKTEAEIKKRIQQLEDDYSHVLVGGTATIFVNAPRALEQVAAESKLRTLHWVLGATYKSKLKGINR